MVLNKRGQVFFFTLMLGTTIIILGLALADSIQFFADDARTNMHCDVYTNLSLADETTCYGLDILKPAATGGIILLGVAILGAGVMLR